MNKVFEWIFLAGLWMNKILNEYFELNLKWIMFEWSLNEYFWIAFEWIKFWMNNFDKILNSILNLMIFYSTFDTIFDIYRPGIVRNHFCQQNTWLPLYTSQIFCMCCVQQQYVVCLCAWSQLCEMTIVKLQWLHG